MPEAGCIETMETLNALFLSPLILNDGHEIHDGLKAGRSLEEIVNQVAEKLGLEEQAPTVLQVMRSWPPLHLEAALNLVQWGLSKLDTPDRVTIGFKGDAEHPETVTKFELRDHTLLIEFAHPPVAAQRHAPASASLGS
jgi:hypothetical protein